jgi:hypothetical protein
MKNYLRIINLWIALLAGVILLTSCGTTEVEHYKNRQPVLNLEDFFSGTTEAWGMFRKRDGEVVKRFHVIINGKRENKQFILDERFSYDDGSIQTRVWTLHKNDLDEWIGVADDVKGDAIGKIAGNTLRWQYTLLLPVDGSVYEMHMDDWMYLIDENSMINRTSMRKFGLEMGEVTLFFQKKK